MNKQEVKKILKNKKVTIDGHSHIGILPKFYYQGGNPYALSLEDMIIRMKILDIDYSVVFPLGGSIYYKLDLESDKVETTTKYSKFPYELVNRNLLNEIYEIYPQYSNKVFPFLMFDPSREAEKQASYMEELSEKYNVFGLKTVTTYIQSYVNDLESKGRAILDLAYKKDFPVVFHSSVHPQDPWASVYDIVDFAERHPDIRVTIAHSARFTKPVLEKAAKLENCFVDVSAFIIHCQLAVSNSLAIATEDIRFPADYTNPASVLTSLVNAYPDTILWGSDTPAYQWIQKYYLADGKLHEERSECSYDEEAKLLHSISDELKTRIAYTNILKFLFGD